MYSQTMTSSSWFQAYCSGTRLRETRIVLMILLGSASLSVGDFDLKSFVLVSFVRIPEESPISC